MPQPHRTLLILLLVGSLAGCRQPADPAPVQTVIDAPVNGSGGGALSGGPAQPQLRAPVSLEGTDWPAIELVSGQATVYCSLAQPLAGGETSGVLTNEAEAASHGVVVRELSHPAVLAALATCRDTGLVRLRYVGKIATDFTALVERVATLADRLDIRRRYLDLDSAGGHVEDAMKAGDAIGASRWTIRVEEGSHCHSACVLILAAGDHRDIQGMVGVHRMIRVGSLATTREQLTDELREVHAHMKDYLERNGAAVVVADLMMTVPNRKLRLLNPNELLEYGLQGPNAIQDDLERIQLSRKCGEDFVRRKDNYDRAFVRQCSGLEGDLNAEEACGLVLRQGFGFPDQACPVDSPLSHLDRDRAPAGQAGQS